MWNKSLKAIFFRTGLHVNKELSENSASPLAAYREHVVSPSELHAPLALQNAFDVLQQVAWTSLGPHVATSSRPVTDSQSLNTELPPAGLAVNILWSVSVSFLYGPLN